MLSSRSPGLFARLSKTQLPRISVQLCASAAVAEPPENSVPPLITRRRVPLPCETGAYSLPPEVVAGLQRVAAKEDVSWSSVRKEAAEMLPLFTSSRLPLDKDQVLERMRNRIAGLRKKYIEKHNLDIHDPDHKQRIERAYKTKWSPQAAKIVQPLVDAHNVLAFKNTASCLSYAMCRGAADYACTSRVLSELHSLQPHFAPTSVMDFGSGMGTVYWAVENLWPQSVKEYMMVDRSAHMNQLAQALIPVNVFEDEYGSLPNEQHQQQVLYRPALLADTAVRFDITFSAFTLMDCLSYEERMKVVDTMWTKTQNYMILIERGSFDGWSTILEARDRVVQLGSTINEHECSKLCKVHKKTAQYSRIMTDDTLSNHDRLHKLKLLLPSCTAVPTLVPTGHVLAPCPQDHRCPRTFAKEGTWQPCVTQTYYDRTAPVKIHEKEATSSELFSYVIMQKGERNEEGWPRLMRSSRQSQGKLTCDLCTSRGFIERTNIRKHVHPLFGKVSTAQTGQLIPVPTEQLPTKELVHLPQDMNRQLMQQIKADRGDKINE